MSENNFSSEELKKLEGNWKYLLKRCKEEDATQRDFLRAIRFLLVFIFGDAELYHCDPEFRMKITITESLLFEVFESWRKNARG